MKENKQYKLNRWYPTLPNDWKTEHDYVYYKEESLMVNKLLMTTHIINFKHLEYRDFWELIEEEKPKPLFVTEDGVNIDQKSSLIVTVVGEDYEISRMFIRDFVKQHSTTTKKVFFVEANADIYIRENKTSPFYVTNDNVNIYHPKENVFLVNEFFEKDEGWYNESVGGKVFFHESNADEYIWRNKPLFTFEEMKKANIDINWCTEDIYYKAKERIEQ